MGLETSSSATASNRPPHLARGVAVALVLGPVVVFGALLVVLTVVTMIIAGLDPRTWFSSSAADWAFGGGFVGGAGSYARFMIGGLLAAGGSAAIRWAFYGDAR